MTFAVADWSAACARLSRFAFEPSMQGGPQLPPSNTVSVTAYKHRDPEELRLEHFHAPQSHWSRVARPDEIFQGIEHKAVASTKLQASIALHLQLGFNKGPRSRNHGPEQTRLDWLDGMTVHIVMLIPARRRATYRAAPFPFARFRPHGGHHAWRCRRHTHNAETSFRGGAGRRNVRTATVGPGRSSAAIRHPTRALEKTA